MRKGGGFGLVVLVVVLAVVLLLAGRAWRSVAPAAVQLETHGGDRAGEASNPGTLPGLNEMQSETDAHAERLRQALDEIE